MSYPACMGGWCQQRDKCERHQQDDRRRVSERLCPPGAERPVEFANPKPALVREVEQWRGVLV